MMPKKWLAALLVCALLLPAAALGEGNALNDFAFRLLAQAMDSGVEAPATSPLSLYLALSMTALGAAGDTRAEFTALLDLEGEALAAYCADLAQSLAAEEEALLLSIANSLWLDNSLALEDAYRARMAEEFAAGAYELDLASPAALEAVNAWVSEKTHGLIESIRDKPYSADTMLVLLNAVHMRARWLSEFEASATREMDFTRADGSVVALDFLRDLRCHRTLIRQTDAEGIVLPYEGEIGGGTLAFVALRPTDDRSIEDYARSLTAESFADALAARKVVLMNFAMPTFTVQSSLDLGEILAQMGLKTAFDAQRADFSIMGRAPGGHLFLSSVVQKLKLIVDEAGTEAAAVTEVVMEVADAMPDAPEPVALTLDSPFVYAVAALETGNVLFLGLYDGDQGAE